MSPEAGVTEAGVTEAGVTEAGVTEAGVTDGTPPPPPPGTVYLVGAGPGDPGLLTVRGAEVLAQADVVVHDRLTDPALLALAPPGAERADVGKQPDDRGDQAAINKLLVARALKGLRVVRLKGGDPFVFGRGGEEAQALIEAGIPLEVVPGVSSAVAAPAYAGVPVTHRGLVTSFTVVAGHSRSVETRPGGGGTNWEALAAAGGTIVVLMGAAHRHQIAARLIGGGLAPSTPVLAVQWGTEPYQLSVRTTLGELGSVELAPPVTIVIGDVAGLELDWRLGRPLAGRSVVVTRAPHQAPALSSRLRDLGARVTEVPVIVLASPADGGVALARAADGASRGAFGWVVFTSANAVERFFAFVPDTRALATTKVAAVGPATAAALARYRVVPDLVPAATRAQGVLAEFAKLGERAEDVHPAPARVLLPQAAGAQPELAHGLRRLGWEVEVCEAYRTQNHPVGRDLLVAASRADAICFASPSSVRAYIEQVRAVPGASVPALVACIGPVTAEAARACGLSVGVEADEQSVAGLADALVSAWPARRR